MQGAGAGPSRASKSVSTESDGTPRILLFESLTRRKAGRFACGLPPQKMTCRRHFCADREAQLLSCLNLLPNVSTLLASQEVPHRQFRLKRRPSVSIETKKFGGLVSRSSLAGGSDSEVSDGRSGRRAWWSGAPRKGAKLTLEAAVRSEGNVSDCRHVSVSLWVVQDHSGSTGTAQERVSGGFLNRRPKRKRRTLAALIWSFSVREERATARGEISASGKVSGSRRSFKASAWTRKGDGLSD